MHELTSRRVTGCVLLAVLAICCVACLEQPPTRGPETPGIDTPTVCLPVACVEAAVVDVIDGDTIKVRVEGALHMVRYIGIDAPERGEPLGPVSTQANRALVGGRTVWLEQDVSETDDYGRSLRYVYLPDGLFVNAELVRQGLARAQAYPPDIAHQEALTRVEEEARAAGRGLWEAAWATGEPDRPTVRIIAVDKRAELVDLANVGDQPQQLTGWSLVSERGDETCPLTGTLAPGAVLQVWARAQDAERGGYNCGFEGNVWNNSEPDTAALYDADGRLVDSFP